MRNRYLGAAALVAGAALIALPQAPGWAQSDDCRLTDQMMKDALADPQPTRPASFFQSNCAFHQWSWMLFVWLTQAGDDNKLRFETLPTAADVINGGRGGDAVEAMAPRLAKSDDIDHVSPVLADDGTGAVDEIEQAGSHGLLVDQQGRAVYYQQYVNNVFYTWAVEDNQLYDPEKLRKFSAEKTIPNDALELKVSWKIVGPNEQTDDMFTTTADIAQLTTTDDGTIKPDPSDVKQETVALVGFHVVGVVPDHPEMIWATFEHNDNAPDFAKGQQPDQPVSDKDFTFYTAGTEASACNQNNAAYVKLKPGTQTLTPVSQVCRQYPYGNEPGAGDAKTNQDNIDSLNRSAWAQMDKFGVPAVWKNYAEIGAIWFKSGKDLVPNDPIDTDDKVTGSLRLNNTTIETFTQDVTSENNCFKCHNTTMKFSSNPEVKPLPGKNVNISHVLVNAYMRNQ